jgi:hypothetical protein
VHKEEDLGNGRTWINKRIGLDIVPTLLQTKAQTKTHLVAGTTGCLARRVKVEHRNHGVGPNSIPERPMELGPQKGAESQHGK